MFQVRLCSLSTVLTLQLCNFISSSIYFLSYKLLSTHFIPPGFVFPIQFLVVTWPSDWVREEARLSLIRPPVCTESKTVAGCYRRSKGDLLTLCLFASSALAAVLSFSLLLLPLRIVSNSTWTVFEVLPILPIFLPRTSLPFQFPNAFLFPGIFAFLPSSRPFLLVLVFPFSLLFPPSFPPLEF